MPRARRFKTIMLLVGMAAGVLFVGCGSKPSAHEKCDRVARLLMPSPTADWVKQCEARASDPETVKTIDCLLAVGPEGVFEKDMKRCGVAEHLPLVFQF